MGEVLLSVLGSPSLTPCAVDLATYRVQTATTPHIAKAPRARTLARSLMISSYRRAKQRLADIARGPRLQFCQLRSDRNAVRTSSAKSFGCSQAAKCPPLG